MIETVTIYAAGSIPGIPGEYPAGIYIVDYAARTITSALPQPAVVETPELPKEQKQPAQPAPETPVTGG